MDKSPSQSSTPTKPQRVKLTEEAVFKALTAIQEENRKTDVITVYGGHPPQFSFRRYCRQCKRRFKNRYETFKNFRKQHRKLESALFCVGVIILFVLLIGLLRLIA